MAGGRLFQTRGPATANTLSPSAVVVRGMSSIILAADREPGRPRPARHWPLTDGLLRLVQRKGDWAGPQPVQAPPLCTKSNSPPINSQCTNSIFHSIYFESGENPYNNNKKGKETHGTPTTVLLYNAPLLCGFLVCP